MDIHPEILRYIDRQFIFSLAVIYENAPYGAPLFYAFDADRVVLLFMSESETIHVRALMNSGICAGTINDCERSVNLVRGLQFTGRAEYASAEDEFLIDKYRSLYPESIKIRGDFFRIVPEKIKMTDNTVSFGFKRRWPDDSSN